MQESEIIQFLIDNLDYFSVSDIISSVFRSLLWMIVKGLAWLTDFCQEFYSKCFEFLDFTTSESVQSFMEEMKLVVVLVLTISIMLIGYKLIFRPQKKPSVITNLFIGMFVLISFTYIMTTINSGMIYSKNYIMNSYGGSGSAANQIISQNLTDLYYVDAKIGLKNMDESNIPHAALTDQNVKMLQFNEVADGDSDLVSSDEAKDILKKKVIYNPKSSADTGQDEYAISNFADFLSIKGGYYRYHLSSFFVILSLLSLVIVFLVMGYKVFKLVWELVTVQFLSIIFSGEIFSGQAMKKLLDFVKNLYVVMFYTIVSIKLYLIASEYINVTFSSGIAAMMLLCLAFAVIDGPNVIEKILGIDAGLNQGMSKLLSFGHLAGGAFRTAQAAYMQHRMNQGMRNISNAINNGGTNTGGSNSIHGANANLNSMNQSVNSSSNPQGDNVPTNFDSGDNTNGNNEVGGKNNEMQNENMPENMGTDENRFDAGNSDAMNGENLREMPTNLDGDIIDNNGPSEMKEDNNFDNLNKEQGNNADVLSGSTQEKTNNGIKLGVSQENHQNTLSSKKTEGKNSLNGGAMTGGIPSSSSEMARTSSKNNRRIDKESMNH